MITDNTAKWRVGSISTPQVNSGDGLLPVGHIYYSMGSSAPAGSLPLSGKLFSRETYKDLWEWVNLHPEQLLSESAWQTKYIENSGLVPFYSEGTDSTNFRVPNCTILGLQKMDYVVDEGKDGYNWWRVWKSGWIEQGGRLDAYTSYTTKTITFPKTFQDSFYHIEFTQAYTGNLYAPVISAKNASSATFVNTHNTDGAASWEARGYGAKPIVDEKVLWCVKAFGNIDEGTGSTTLDSIANNITQLNTKVDNWVSGTLDSHATAIAEMQSYFTGNMEEVVLYDKTNNTSSWTADVTLSDSLYNYDFFKVEVAGGANLTGNQGGGSWLFYPVSNFKKMMERAKSATTPPVTWAFLGDSTNGSWYWNINPSLSTETFWKCYNQTGCYIRKVWGYKLKANGITNKSAIDVSQISDKISSLLTSDNHLRLPSGLEVW